MSVTHPTTTRPTPSGPHRPRPVPHRPHAAPRPAPRVRVVLACPVCEVSSGPYGSVAEARFLADRHDALHHCGRTTIEVTDTTVCESCRQAPATTVWVRPEAGAPFALCAGCHPDHSTSQPPLRPARPRIRTRTRGRAGGCVMGAVVVFILVFGCTWLTWTYGAQAALLVGLGMVALWVLVAVILPTLYANRAWFVWHLTHYRPLQWPADDRAVRGPVDDAAEMVRAGRPDLDGELRSVGWDAWAAGHRLRVLDIAPDPGHPGADLTLVEVVTGRWTGTRLVQVIDASPNDRGVHERHGIPVPPHCRTAVEAIASTFGLTPDSYRPERHT